LLACTHYPLLFDKIRRLTPLNINIISQGEIIAESLKDYLCRHPEIDKKCGKNSNVDLYTTDSAEDFDRHSTVFYGKSLKSIHIDIR